MRRALPFLLLAALFAVVGCAPSYVRAKIADPTHLHFRVISLSPGTSEIIAALGLGNVLKGRTEADDFPASIKSTPVVASLKPNYEAIKAIGPDLIVYDGQLYNPQDIDKIKQLGVQVFTLDGDTVKAFIRNLYELSNLIGGQTFFEDYVERINVEIQNAKSEPFNPPPKVTFLSPGEGGQSLIPGVNSFLADVIKISGGVPVGPPSNKFELMNPELLVSQNPDVIFVPSPTSLPEAEALVHRVASDPKLQSISAVKKGHIYAIDENIALRRGERVDFLIKNVHKELALAEQR